MSRSEMMPAMLSLPSTTTSAPILCLASVSMAPAMLAAADVVMTSRPFSLSMAATVMGFPPRSAPQLYLVLEGCGVLTQIASAGPEMADCRACGPL